MRNVRKHRMRVRLSVMGADNGDCLLISFMDTDTTFNILVDGGTVNTFRRPNGAPGPLRLALDNLKGDSESIDLGILTHIDGDHIGGMKRAFETSGYLGSLTKKLWYNSSVLITERAKIPDIINNHIKLDKDNSAETSFKQAYTLEKILMASNYWHRELILAGQIFKEGPCTFTILSPNENDILELAKEWPKEYISAYTAGTQKSLTPSLPDLLARDIFKDDEAPANRSSIAFLLEAKNFKALLLGDAPDDIIRQSLHSMEYSDTNKLKLDFVKISHHGSKHNTSQDFLSMIETQAFIISTNGLGHLHPDRVTIARILHHHPNAKIYFNYENNIKSTFSSSEISLYGKNISTIQELDFYP